MIGTQRQNEIMSYIKKHDFISVNQIVKIFYVSEATARRDLNELEKAGLIRRVFGGATLVVSSGKPVSLFARQREDKKEKIELCNRAKQFIHDGDVVFMDASSSASFLIPHLKTFRDIIVVTSGLKIAEALSDTNIKVYCTGGYMINTSYSFVGREAEKFVENFNADVCFVSSKGLSEDGLLTDNSYEETQLRKAFIKNSKVKVALITSGKIGKKYLHTLCRKDELDHLIMSPQIAETGNIQ